ncbi:aspartate/glutamate racemase family protein [Alsobacter sp. KACC 23698]|uniref:Aspartate/glutamate racemase family protein n=1 Tax=Alsobacter sp. KACC 23698 TaxID=3149229 RepID=A0AAU7JE33_9HYPH
MLRLLLVNGNMTQAVTDAVCAEARRVCGAATVVEGATARFGAQIVTTHAGAVVAAHAVLDLLAERSGGYDAAILAISFDCGLAAARELFRTPVIGMTQAAMLAACDLAPTFRMIVFGATALPLYEDLVRLYGMHDRVSRIHCIDVAPTAYLDGQGRDDAILAELAGMPQAPGAPVVICGAALAGTAARLQPLTPLRLLDGIACGVASAERRAAEGSAPGEHAPIPVRGLSPALTAAFERRS